MPAKKPTVYLDTSFISALFLRGFDVFNVNRHMQSRVWWEEESRFFSVFSSSFTESELAEGHYPWQRKALSFARRLSYLPHTKEVDVCAAALLGRGIAPDSKRGDAAQLATAIVHRMDYLVSWNYAHLVNVLTQQRLEEFCKSKGLRCPFLVSPENIPKVALGQRVVRRDRHA